MTSFGQSEIQRRQSEWELIQAADFQRRERCRMERGQRDILVKKAATAETLRKLDAPVIDRLHVGGKLDDDQYRVAQEITRVYRAVTSTLFARTANLEREGSGGGTAGFVPNIFTCGYQDRYLPWTREMEGEVFRAGRTRLDVVLMLVNDNYGPDQIGQILGSDRRTVLAVIQESLTRYAEMAGWVTVRNFSAPAVETTA